MPAEANIWLEKCFELRHSGDYNFEYDVTEAEAVQSIEYAKEFLLFTEAYLREQNFID